MHWWEVLDVTDWPALQNEPRGLRAKLWVTDPSGHPWLRKGIRGWDKVEGGSRPAEPAIEAFTLELARRCGLPVAHGRAAIWRNEAGLVRGFVSKKFHGDDEQQWTGAELVPEDADDARMRIAATLPLVYDALRSLTSGGFDTLVPFVRVILFDAWIGNGDRHLGNWAVLVPGRAKRFAPMFDTAGCLGAELRHDHHLLSANATDEDIVAYAHACRSGFGDGVSRPGISQREVLEIARQWPEWKSVYHELLPRFRAALASDVGAMLDEVPEDWWPLPRRQFARRILIARAKILEGAAP